MPDSPTAIVLAAAETLDGTEHVEVSQSGNRRAATVTQIAAQVVSALVLPSADPHVVGALWNNAGTIAISSG